MPTGGGKSLCYQVPALMKNGLCLVISPLIALMKDQVENLRKKNITAFAIYTGMSRQEVINTLKVAANSNCKFLYVSPERLETTLFKEYLPALNINLVAVDEAHCVSQWGYDFRPPYLRIAALREEITSVPVLALTASATPDVQKDICEKLTSPSAPGQNRGNWRVFRQPFERPNLSYSVFKAESKITKLTEILKSVPGSGIVYCKSRKRTKEISELLQMQNISAGYYHAGLSQKERNHRQEEWIQNKIRIIVCTNAFGMGIDKPDVRTVVHADVPDCLENYYQEAGRAGRDGKKAYAVLLYDDKDLHEMEHLAAIRFPCLDDIRNVYQSLANYLQVPAETGAGRYFDFDINDFIKKFRLNSHTVIYALKALEHDEWLSFNEQIFVPASVQFTISKNNLYPFENENPGFSPLIKTLLRTYEGIFDFPASISEITVARLLKTDATQVRNDLLQLHRHGVIQYHPQKDTPQLLLLRNRVRKEELYINTSNYKKRKDQFVERIKAMAGYISNTADCRSKLTANYFGDETIRACGICDNCLKKKSTSLKADELEKIYNRIKSVLHSRVLPVKDLLHQLDGIKKEKAWKAIEFLQAENKIEMDKEGSVKLK